MNTAWYTTVGMLIAALIGCALWALQLRNRHRRLGEEAERTRAQHESNLQRASAEAQESVRQLQSAMDQQLDMLNSEAARIRTHYEEEAKKIHATAETQM